jgi:catalase
VSEPTELSIYALKTPVAKGLGIRELPPPTKPAAPIHTELKESAALSILRNGPETFEGRKVGAIITEGVDAKLVKALKDALTKEGATLEFVAPTAGEVEMNDGSMIQVQQRVDGGPSVLYDAVALLVSDVGGQALVNQPAARYFVSDAFAHAKFIAYVDGAVPLLEKMVGKTLDEGFVSLRGSADVQTFIQACRGLRFWNRVRAKP